MNVEDPANSTDQESVQEQTNDAATGYDEKPRRRSGGLAMLLSILALVAVGWLIWQQQQLQTTDNSRLLNSELQSLKRALDKLDGATDYNAETLQQLTARLDAQGSRIDTLPVRIDQIEDLLRNLPATDEDARRKILNLEADWYLRLAETQLTVARNIGATQVALALANERFAELADPSVTPIRNRIDETIGELQIRQQHPIATDTAIIQNIIDQIPVLKLQENVPQNFGGTPTAPAAGEGVDRALSAIRNAFSEVISVKRSNADIVPQLGDADAAILRRSLLLELQTAKLALLQDEPELYRTSLEVVERRLLEWFDTESVQVTGALEDIDTLLNSGKPDSLPDIAEIRESLQRVRSSNP
jgi:uroporphyrin-3 C-methyltransferase